MSGESKALTAQEQLANEIVDELVARQLIDESYRDRLLQQIVAGRIKEDDWSLWVDITATHAAETEGNVDCWQVKKTFHRKSLLAVPTRRKFSLEWQIV